MDQYETVCHHCGFDFPMQGQEEIKRTGLAYSKIGDIALIVGQVATAIGCVLAVIYFIVFVLALHIFQAFTTAITFFVQLALFVVFVRIYDMKQSRSPK
jgi:hypothetical protein